MNNRWPQGAFLKMLHKKVEQHENTVRKRDMTNEWNNSDNIMKHHDNKWTNQSTPNNENDWNKTVTHIENIKTLETHMNNTVKHHGSLFVFVHVVVHYLLVIWFFHVFTSNCNYNANSNSNSKSNINYNNNSSINNNSSTTSKIT
jgi:hypothetical protein